MIYSDIHIVHIHIAENLSVAVQSHVQAVVMIVLSSQGPGDVALWGF